MKLLVINGPNLNMLGVRERHLYGTEDYAQLCAFLAAQADALGVEAEVFQSNHEGALVDCIQGAYQRVDGIVINPAAYTHTSVAILDALKAVNIRACEVHLTDVAHREDYRQISFVREACEATFTGEGFESYRKAMAHLANAAR